MLLSFICGLFAGTILGITLICLIIASKDKED